MSGSIDGEISYGIFVGEDEFPWDAEQHEGYLEDWWRETKGYTEPFELYGDDGKRLPRYTDDDASRYYAHGREWDNAHPLPIEMVNVCSGDCPMWIVAVPSTVRRCGRGSPTDFDPRELSVPVEGMGRFDAFCKEHGIVGEQKWWLSSYWG